MNASYAGGCQCGKVRFKIDLDLDGEVISCSCSRCRRLGSLLAFATTDAFDLQTGADAMTEYVFNRHVIRHMFCRACGIQSFAHGKRPNDGADMVAINVRCLDDIDLGALKIKQVDGRKF